MPEPVSGGNQRRTEADTATAPMIVMDLNDDQLRGYPRCTTDGGPLCDTPSVVASPEPLQNKLSEVAR
jgi:hypothetical protein